MDNKVGIGLMVAVLVLSVGVFLKKDATVEVRTVDGQPVQVVGGQPSPDVYTHTYMRAGLTEGSNYTISTTSSTYTLKDGEMRDNKVITIGYMAYSAALALTLPASTTWPSLAKVGDTQEWIIDNQHTAAATTTTITAGTGVDIDGTTANDDILNGGVSGILKCWRLPIGDIRCVVEEMVDAG